MSEENETVNTCGGVSSADEIEHANVVFPPESVRERAHIQSMDQYREMYRRSIEDPEAFWREVKLILPFTFPFTFSFIFPFIPLTVSLHPFRSLSKTSHGSIPSIGVSQGEKTKASNDDLDLAS